jgi:hypothetical protein
LTCFTSLHRAVSVSGTLPEMFAQTSSLGVTDGSGTINPAALNSGMSQSQTRIAFAGTIILLQLLGERSILVILTYQLLPSSVLTWKKVGALTPETSPRGIKRSRSPDTYGDLAPGDGLGDDGMWLLAEKSGSFDLLVSLRL